MSEIKNIFLPADTWININAVSGIDVGTPIIIQNDGVPWVRIQESDTQPAEDSEGKILTNLDKSSAETDVSGGAKTVWARSSIAGRSSSLAVQVLGDSSGDGAAGAWLVYVKKTNDQVAVFTSESERDSYFSSNLNELLAIDGSRYIVGIGTTEEDTSTVPNDGWYSYKSTRTPQWETAINIATGARGEKGDPGQDGAQIIGTPLANEVMSYAGSGSIKGSGVIAENGSIKTAAGSVSIGNHSISSVNDNLGFRNQSNDNKYTAPLQEITENGYEQPKYTKFTTDFQPDVVRNDVTDTQLNNPSWVISNQPQNEVLFRLTISDVVTPITDVYFYGETSGEESFRAHLGDLQVGENNFTFEFPLFIKTLETVTLSMSSENGDVVVNGNSSGVPAYKVGIRFYEETTDSVPHDSEAISELRGGVRPDNFDSTATYPVNSEVYNPDTNKDYIAKVQVSPGVFNPDNWEIISTLDNAKPSLIRDRLARLPSGQKLSAKDVDFIGGIQCIYVSNNGDDNNTGYELENPVQSLAKAYELAENLPESSSKYIVCTDASIFSENLSIDDPINVYMPLATINGNIVGYSAGVILVKVGNVNGNLMVASGDNIQIDGYAGQIDILGNAHLESSVKISYMSMGDIVYAPNANGIVYFAIEHAPDSMVIPQKPENLKVNGFIGNKFVRSHFPDGVSDIYVAGNGDDNNDGLSPETPVATLQKAYNLASSLPSNSPRAIWCFDSSTFNENININEAVNFEMPQAKVNGNINGYTGGVINVNIGEVNGNLSVASGDNFNINSYEGTITVQNNTHIETSVKISHMSSGNIIYAAGLNGYLYFGIEHVPSNLVFPDTPDGLIVGGFVGDKFGRKDLPEGNQSVYVSNNGDDTKGGRSLSEPVKTLTRAADILYGLPETTPRFIVCEDSSVFTSNFVAVEDVNMFMPYATITGNLSSSTNGSLNLTLHKLSGNITVSSGEEINVGEYDGTITLQGVEQENTSIKINKLVAGNITYASGVSGALFYGIEHVHDTFTLPTVPSGLSVYGYIADLFGSNETPAEIRDALQSLSGEDRLDATAIKNLPERSATEIRDELQSLTGEERLSASAIKDLPEEETADEIRDKLQSLVGSEQLSGEFVYGATRPLIEQSGAFTITDGSWYTVAIISDPLRNSVPFIEKFGVLIFDTGDVAALNFTVASEFGDNSNRFVDLEVDSFVDTNGFLTGVRLLKQEPTGFGDFYVQVQLSGSSDVVGDTLLFTQNGLLTSTLQALPLYVDVPGQVVGAELELPLPPIQRGLMLHATIDGSTLQVLTQHGTYTGNITVERVDGESAGAWTVYPSQAAGHVFGRENTYMNTGAMDSSTARTTVGRFSVGYPEVKLFEIGEEGATLVDGDFSIELKW